MELQQQLIKEGRITDPDSAKGHLLACAAALFKEKGYERTTVRDLAREVGIQSGSLFHHYKNKEAILLAVMEETIILNTARMQLALDQVDDSKDQLLALIKCELDSVLGDTGAAMTVLVYEWRSLNEGNQAHILKLRDHYEGLWMLVLNQAKESGQVVADPFVLRRLLTGALSWTINWYKADGNLSLDALAEQALTLAIKQ